MRSRRTALTFTVIVLCTLAVGLAVGNRKKSAGPAQGHGLNGQATTKPTGPYLRVGTFNIDGGEGLDGRIDLERTARCLQKLNFIGMNEVHGFLWSNPSNQATALGDILKMPYLYVPAEQQWGHDTFGNAVFSDLPVRHWQRVELPSLLFHAKRNYLLSDVDWNGTIVHMITTHTDWKAGGAKQFEIVRNLFLNLPAPAILMGDLNTPHSNPLIADLQIKPGVEEAVGKVLEPIPGRVDWIFLRGLTTTDAGQVDLKASDHPAYWAQVKLR